MPLAEWYLHLKLLHITAAIVWGAVAVGAWWFVLVSWWQRRAAPDDPELERRDDWVRYHFLVVVIAEHLAFLLLIPSGVLLALALGMDMANTPPWLRWKAGIALVVFVPMEVVDVWLSHWLLPRRMRDKDAAPAAYRQAVRWHEAFLWCGTVVIGVGLPAVLYLAVFKPS